ncbi:MULTISPECIES: ribose-phosphate pyrophosphokinase [unclassified Kitasatospora]|uniref:ribose-phosphate diphosphokinase n=1 Tax=unclassified Kitasatospora TaxID=2633591 RepID=UPI0034023618
MTGPRILSGTAHPGLGDAVSEALGTEPVECEVKRFPDGELQPTVGHVRGEDVYLVELLLLLDACRRAGARRITAVVPYFGYARQDRRTRSGQSVGARVALDALTAAGAHRLVVVDPHSPALEAMSAVLVETLTAVPLLAGTLAEHTPGEAVVVSPDLGAVKLAERYGALLGRPVAVVRKTRLSGSDVQAEELVGEVADRPAVIVDDMISTGGTIEAAVQALLAHGAATDITVAATHPLFVARAAERLGRLPISLLVVTNTLPPDHIRAMPFRVRTVAPLLAEAIALLHGGEPLDTLLAHA